MQVPPAWGDLTNDEVVERAKVVLHLLVEGPAVLRDKLTDRELRALLAFFNEFDTADSGRRMEGGLALDLRLRREWRLRVTLVAVGGPGREASNAYQIGTPASGGGWTLLVHDPIAAANLVRVVERMQGPDEEDIQEACVLTLIKGGFSFMAVQPRDSKWNHRYAKP
jgi:hypothetical protein